MSEPDRRTMQRRSDDIERQADYEQLAATIRKDMADAVSEGIARAMTEENARAFFRTGMSVVREELRGQAGDIVLSGVRKLLTIAFWALVVVAGVYSIGGWSGLRTLLSATFAGRGP